MFLVLHNVGEIVLLIIRGQQEGILLLALGYQQLFLFLQNPLYW